MTTSYVPWQISAAFLLVHCSPSEPAPNCARKLSCGALGGDAVMPASVSPSTAAPASSAGSTPAAAPTMPATVPGASMGSSPVGGALGSAGSTGGAAGQLSSAAQGGQPASAGTLAGGMSAAGIAAAPPAADENGIALAKLGDSKTGSGEYLNLGDFRILVNKWGSDELGCDTKLRVFVDDDRSFGWRFERGGCGGDKQKPDYPEVEFGMHPFGLSNSSATTPQFSSTTVLPLQIKNIASASVLVDQLQADIEQATTWNIDVEFWLSQKNPVTEPEPGVYAELIAFWGWQDSWGCDQSGSVAAGDKRYDLCHQDDNWGNGWRYFQFRANDGPAKGYSGKVDVIAFLDWLVDTRGYSTDLWVTRIEVGSEIDDNTSGTVRMKDLTFELNGISKSAQFAP